MSRKTTSKVFGLIFMAMVLTLFFCNPVYASARKQQLRIATAPVGAIMYVFGAAMSDVLDKHNGPKLEVLPQMAMVGLGMFRTQECDLVMIPNDDLYMAYTGRNIYKKLTKGKGFDVRVLMLGTRIPAGQVVGGDSGIKTYEDLRGKRVVLTFGSSVALNLGSKAALYGGGLTEKDVKVMKCADVPSAARMVIEKKADACYGSVGVPVFREIAAARGGARHLGIVDTPESWKRVHGIFHGYFPMHLKPGPSTVKEPITMVGRNHLVAARPDLPDEAAYIFTKILWENDKELGPKHPRLKDWVKKNFVSTNASAPYHSGAIKFYKEVGVWTPEMEKFNQEMLAMKKK